MLKLYHVFLSWGIYKGAAVYLLDSPGIRLAVSKKCVHLVRPGFGNG
jgi:hypothetical protein